MAIVTILGVYPASLFVPWLLNPLIGSLPKLLQVFFIAVGIVTLLTWVIMPALVKVLKPWL
jgi:antibiotic biosynthesis monooxygenase (ABM) superfamily enzyme